MRWISFVMLISVAVSAAVMAADDEDNSEFIYDTFPMAIILDAYAGEPAEYAYWKATNYDDSSSFNYWDYRTVNEESNSWGPSITKRVYSAGTYSTVFRFYNSRNRLIKRVPVTVYVDENGISSREWNYSGWYGTYSYESWRSGYFPEVGEESAVNPLDQPWPEARLTAQLSGDGPWEVTLNTTVNLPEGLVVSHEWDFNNDGTFGLNTGQTSSQIRSLTKPGKYIFEVRITDSRGYTDTSVCEIDTRTDPAN